MNGNGQPAPPQGSSIVVDEDGVYRWVYEFNLFTNPTILLTIVKIFLGIIVALIALGVVLMVPDLVQGYAGAEDVAGVFVSGGGIALLFIVLTIVGYVIYAIMNGGKYCVVFTMDDEGITHKQLPRQYKKAQVIGALNVIAGVASGNLSQTGLGILAATHDMTSSNFASVRSVKGSRALRVIKVNEPMAKNQVYVEPGDYDFVFGYIRDHCPNAEVKGQLSSRLTG